ncbi:MAG TPA: ATP-binding protein [Candidatus Limnocylindrales bacterium]|nr:ATP-binding protein [Candidatus Limnocylindrales bacterium]
MSSAPRLDVRPFAVKTALVVDADPQVESLLLASLKPGQWVIQHAPDNRSALAQAEGRAFDLILTSEKSSGSEDVELLRKLRRVRPHTRLIILADESTPADVIASMREHVFSYFSKPYSPGALAEMIRIAAEGPCWDDGIEIVSATPEWIRVMARCTVNTADRLLQFLNEIADLPEAEKHAVAMASREILLNAIEHGGRLDPSKYVEISYVRAKHMVECLVKDPGEGFALDEIPHAAIANPLDDPFRHMTIREIQGLRPGGYGVLLAQHLVDELLYNEKGNEVLLVKYIDPSRIPPA